MRNPWGRDEDPEPISDVNVVPLADVSLVLLILLLVLSPMAAQSMLHVRSAAAGGPAEVSLPPPEPEPVLAVGLSRSGYVAEGRLIPSDAEFHAWLVLALARRADKKVFLAPELDVDNGHVVHALEAIQSCGAQAALVQAQDPASRP